MPKKTAAPGSAPVLAPTIFHEPWWIDIASGGSWSEAVVTSGGLIVGRLPYQISKKTFGMTVLDMPALVHVLGPAIATQPAGNKTPRILREISIILELVEQLPPASHIFFRLHGGMTNTLPFEVAGFSSKPGFTVEVRPDDHDTLWRQMRDKTRNVIRRADECLHVEVLDNPEQFLAFYEDNLKSMGRKNIYQHSTCFRLLTECLRRNTGRILVAKDQQGEMQSAIFTIWDKTAEYYFMSTRRPNSNNGATSLLIWKALQHASSLGLTFDMDGIHIVNQSLPNLLLLTGFGGVITPRFCVQRSSTSVQIAQGVRDCWSKIRERTPILGSRTLL